MAPPVKVQVMLALGALATAALVVLQPGLLASADSNSALTSGAGPASTAAYGARCIGGTYDDTSAFQAAIDTGQTVYAPALGGHCRITQSLFMRTPGQILSGDGRARTKIEPDLKFGFDAAFIARTGEPGPVWRDFAVVFPAWPSHVPPPLARRVAFIANETPRFQMRGIGCYFAATCIDMRGNSGGANIDDVELSAAKSAIRIDGALDTVRIASPHCFPFFMTPEQITTYEKDSVCLEIGKVDDIQISRGLKYGGTGIEFHSSSLGSATGDIEGFDFDGVRIGIVMEGGSVRVSGGYFACCLPTAQLIQQTGGSLSVTNALLGASSNTEGQASSLPIISVQAGNLTVNQTTIALGSDDRPLANLANGRFIFSNNLVEIVPLRAQRKLVQPKVLVAPSARLTAMGNAVGDIGSGSGTFFDIQHDNFHVILGNSTPGWTNLLPKNKSQIHDDIR